MVDGYSVRVHDAAGHASPYCDDETTYMDDKLPYPNHRSIKVFEFKNSCADSPTAEDFFRYDRHTAVCEFENWEAVM